MKKREIVFTGFAGLLFSTIALGFTLFSAKEEGKKTNLPVPVHTNERLFYIQRTLNSNTIVYDANFDKDGCLNRKEPVHVYWIRYEEDGSVMPLRAFEKEFVFGVKVNRDKSTNDEFEITIAAFKNRAFYVKQLAPFRAVAYTVINNKKAELIHIFAKADGTRVFSKILYLELFGNIPNENTPVYERIITK